jgi:hypothetical protein
MRPIANSKLICLKGILFLIGGTLAAVGILIQTPTLKTAALLAVAVWCFARFYYFAFYAIERYVDPGYRFSGLVSLFAHLMRRK